MPQVIHNPVITEFGVEAELDGKLANVGNIQKLLGNDNHIVIRTAHGDYSPTFTCADLRDNFMELVYETGKTN